MKEINVIQLIIVTLLLFFIVLVIQTMIRNGIVFLIPRVGLSIYEIAPQEFKIMDRIYYQNNHTKNEVNSNFCSNCGISVQ